MSNLGPLPTDFLASADCKSALDGIYYVDNKYLVQGSTNQVTCYPNGYAGNTAQYYSPARCPSGFTQACSKTNRVDTLEETISICCPTQRIYQCQSTSSLTWESTLGCVSQITQLQTLDVIISDGSASPYSANVGAIGAYSIQVRYQSTDFISTTLSATSIAPSSTNTSTNDTSDLPRGNDNSRDISTGAAVGIAIGAFAGAVIITVLVWYLVKRKRRQRQPDPGMASKPPSTIQQLYPAEATAAIYPHELHGGNEIHELSTSGSKAPIGHIRYGELPSNT